MTKGELLKRLDLVKDDALVCDPDGLEITGLSIDASGDRAVVYLSIDGYCAGHFIDTSELCTRCGKPEDEHAYPDEDGNDGPTREEV